MNTVFFSNPDNQYLISNKLRELNAMDTDGAISFSKERDYLVMGALQLFSNMLQYGMKGFSLI